MPTSTPADHVRQNALFAVVAFVFSTKRYTDIASENDAAVALSARDLREAFESGRLGSDWERGVRDQAREYAMSLKASVRKSWLIATVFAFAAMVFLILHGDIRPSLAFSGTRFATGVGSFFGLWAALFALYPPVETYKGDAMHEKVAHVISLLLVLLSVVSFVTAMM